ncbi:MAG: DEAD/DEAH box helicase [Bacteroidota bacterium]|nr:DEAD/DEAH box helicase [Bacteroidota bacterium]
MSFTPRPYQQEAINAGVAFFQSKDKSNALQVLPTGSGKSVVIANIASALEEQVLVFQPSKQILEQNVAKFMSYGYRAGVYSASAGSKFIDRITFATIGSVIKKKHLFRDVKYIIIDECHLVNSKGGMYEDFIKSLPMAKVLGLTATPYRLSNSFEGAMLKFLTRTSPRIFKKMIYYIQNDVLFNAGHLAKLEYFAPAVVDRTRLQTNSTGTDFTEASIRSYYRQINMPQVAANYSNRLLAKRKNLMVFCSLIEEAVQTSKGIPGSAVMTGKTDQKIVDKTLNDFKAGRLRCLIVVGMLTTGFDYPELESILIVRSTMSLSLYYQIVGRAMRPHPDKESAWIVDLGGNYNFFGKIETMKIEFNEKGLPAIYNNGKQLTNITFSKN